MKASTLTPVEIFGNQVRYVVPLFQRPYVWTKVDQWQPLWEDARNLAERVLEGGVLPQFATVPPHFLGAIVLDQQNSPSGFINVRHVVDGQQRLTTLQLLLDAAQEVAEMHGTELDSETLRMLVLNGSKVTQSPDEQFKVWPTDSDQEAFRATMTSGVAVPSELASSRVSQAHAFFLGAILEWAEPLGDPDKCRIRVSALTTALQRNLKLVVIDLEPGDNAQVIFETLNHRGSPLLAADLIKNHIFQLAQVQGLDVVALYQRFWKGLDSDHWRALVAQGRLYRPRIDVFLNYWLTMKLLRDVPSDHIFSDFRDYVANSAAALEDILAELAMDADVYRQLENLEPQSVPGRFSYRVIRALDTRAVTPVLLWLLRWDATELDPDQRDRALLAIESWLVRRTLARLTGKNVNQVMLELLKALAGNGPSAAGSTAESYLTDQRADSRFWPDDEIVRRQVASMPAYKALTRARLRMILEALEDELRSDYSEGQPAPLNMTVEHVLPQQWQEHWPVGNTDPFAGAARDAHVHRLGNLTLVSGKLNPSMSHRAWASPDGRGKRDYLLEHSALKLNAELVSGHARNWTEADIDARTSQLTDRILAVWPRPADAPVTSASSEAFDEHDEVTQPDDHEEEMAGLASHDGKYRDLWQWLGDQRVDRVPLSFDQVEEVMGLPLPNSARHHMAQWYGYEGSALGRAIRDAGWKASDVNLTAESVVFVRG